MFLSEVPSFFVKLPYDRKKNAVMVGLKMKIAVVSKPTRRPFFFDRTVLGFKGVFYFSVSRCEVCKAVEVQKANSSANWLEAMFRSMFSKSSQ